jgi:hypothetical protein
MPRLEDWRQAIGRVRARYEKAHGRPPRLYRPHRFTEKIQWRKLFDLKPIYATFCDKLAVREYIAAHLGRDLLVPLLWSGANPDDLPFGDLEPPYVVKSSHASGHVMIVSSRQDLDIPRAKDTMRGWLQQNYGTISDEPGYDPVPRRLLVERQVFAPGGGRPLERRLFVFNGQAQIINTVMVIDGEVRNGAFHSPDWQRYNWILHSPLRPEPFPRPQRLNDLIVAAERVGTGLDHIRVDFFDCGPSIYIGELTPYSWSGLSSFRPDDADYALGSYWKLRAPMTRAAATMLFHDRTIRLPRRVPRVAPPQSIEIEQSRP